MLENVRTQLLPSNTLMQEEPRLLLQDFINDPHNYVGIMRAIASGAITNNRIVTRTGLAKGHVSKYLSILRNTEFIERAVPVTEDPAKSRRGHYYIIDPFLRFFYRFISANQAKLALGEQQQILDHIEDAFSEFIEETTWRELCREWVLRASLRDEIPLTLQQVGAAWYRNDFIEVVGINEEERTLVIGACLWENETRIIGRMEALVGQVDAILPSDASDWRVFLMCFSSSGWRPEVETRVNWIAETAKRTSQWKIIGHRLVDLETIDRNFAQWIQINYP